MGKPDWLEPLNPVPVVLGGTAALDELQELLNEAGVTATLDFRRDITLCAKCGKRAERTPQNPFNCFTTPVPGTRKEDCRRLCPGCAQISGLVPTPGE